MFFFSQSLVFINDATVNILIHTYIFIFTCESLSVGEIPGLAWSRFQCIQNFDKYFQTAFKEVVSTYISSSSTYESCFSKQSPSHLNIFVNT